MVLLELLSIWLPPVLQIIALIVLKGWWKLASWLGMAVWTVGWVMIFYINLTGFVAILFYLVLFAACGMTRAAGGHSRGPL